MMGGDLQDSMTSQEDNTGIDDSSLFSSSDLSETEAESARFPVPQTAAQAARLLPESAGCPQAAVWFLSFDSA